MIELTDVEQGLLAKIAFTAVDHEQLRASLEPAEKLAKSLLARRAVPEVRLRYFTDPECNPGGRGKSRKDVFEANGTVGNAILGHGNFLRYLRYFIYGPSLPIAVMNEFRSAVESMMPVTSGDLEPLRKLARAQTRKHGLAAYDACDELFKLAMECGLPVWYAKSIRDTVRTVK